MTKSSRPNWAVLYLSWSDLTCVWHSFLLCPKTKGGCMLQQLNQIHLQTSFPKHFQKIRVKTTIIFPWQFLKHPNLEIVAAVSLYPNENQFQDSGPPRFKRLQTQENPGKHFSSAAQWEGQICVCVYNGCEVISALTQQQMMERDSGHTCTRALPSTCARTHRVFSPGKQLMTHLLLHCEVLN